MHQLRDRENRLRTRIDYNHNIQENATPLQIQIQTVFEPDQQNQITIRLS